MRARSTLAALAAVAALLAIAPGAAAAISYAPCEPIGFQCGQLAVPVEKLYRSEKVKTVNYLSFDGNKQPIEGFTCRQEVNSNFTQISTYTNTSLSGASENSHYFNTQGQLIRSLDTADGNKAEEQEKAKQRRPWRCA